MTSPSPQPEAQDEAQEREPHEPELAAFGEPTEDDRVPRKLFVGALIALLLAAIGFAIQTGRVGDYQGQILGLQAEVAGLASELDAAQQRVEAFERERAEIRQSVAQLREDVLALDALVGNEAPAPEPTAVLPELSGPLPHAVGVDPQKGL